MKNTNELSSMMEQSPSVVRNSIVIRFFRVINLILAILFLLIGISFLVNVYDNRLSFVSEYHFENCSNTDALTEVLKFHELCSALFFIVLSFAFFWQRRLYRLILERNRFIWKLQLWVDEQEKEEDGK